MPFRFVIIAALVLLSTITLRSQTYPRAVKRATRPRHSPVISQRLLFSGNDNLRVFILFTDFAQPTYQVKLKFKLEGQNISIKQTLRITLDHSLSAGCSTHAIKDESRRNA